MKSLKTLLMVFLVLVVSGCATKLASNLEAARFALDQEDWDEAISKASTALAEDDTNIEAARILASAYFGRSGLDYLDLAEGIIDLENASTESDLERIANVLPDDATMSDLRLAIETIEGISGLPAVTSTTAVADEELADAIFDLGMMVSIEHFALGVYSSNFKTTFDPALIDDADAAAVQSDLVSFDNRLLQSGLAADESYLSDVRKAFCVLESITAGEGFTTGEYRAWVACELSGDPTTVDTTVYSPDIANCAAVNPDAQGASVTACYESDTSL